MGSVIGLIPALALAGGQLGIILNRSDQYSHLLAHGVTVSGTITDCPTQTIYNGANQSNTYVTTCDASFLLHGRLHQETILGVSDAVNTPQPTQLLVDPSNPAVDYLVSDVHNGSGTGAGSFFTSILGVLAVIWAALWGFLTFRAWRRRYRLTHPKPFPEFDSSGA